MSLMVQITLATELKDLQQRVARAQERQQKHHKHLDEFQEICGQLDVKFVTMLQAIQENWQLVDSKVSEEHLVQQTLTNCQSIASKV